MRVRFFEIGRSDVVFRCEQFPAALSVDPAGELTTEALGVHPACVVDEVGGQLVFRKTGFSEDTLVNDAPLVTGPLLPGDQLSVHGHRYVVSYERTTNQPLPDSWFRIAAT